MVDSPGWTYFERIVYSVDCHSDRFECPNGKCINKTEVCDGRNDCGDRSDEVVCQHQLGFQVRLAGSNKTNEGRVEVKGKTFLLLSRSQMDSDCSFGQFSTNGEPFAMTSLV